MVHVVIEFEKIWAPLSPSMIVRPRRITKNGILLCELGYSNTSDLFNHGL